MCRLAYITKRWRTRDMKHWFHTLVKSQGGDGNGLASGREVYKGVGITVAECVTAICGSDRPVLWHTRRVSSGQKCDQLCHPFKCDGGWLAHNGHWTTGANGALLLADLGLEKGLSDTAVFAWLASELGFSKACKRWEPSGVWLHMNYVGDLTVYKNGGSLHYCPDLGAYGSEPCQTRGDWYPVKDGVYFPGDEPEEKREMAAATGRFTRDARTGLFTEWVGQ